MRIIPIRTRRSFLSLVAVVIVLTEIGAASFVASMAGLGVPPPQVSPPSNPAQANGVGLSQASDTASSFPSGRRIGFWTSEDATLGLGSNCPAPQQFFNNYFHTPPYPATTVYTSGITFAGAVCGGVGMSQTTWLNQVSSLADHYPNIGIIFSMFIDLSGNMVVGRTISITPGFTLHRESPLTAFTVSGLSPSTSHTMVLQDSKRNYFETITAFTTNATGGWAGAVPIASPPNAAAVNDDQPWYIVISGTSLWAEVGVTYDQTQAFTDYVTALRGHSSIYGFQYEQEYFGYNPQIQAKFDSVVTAAGYVSVILGFSAYPTNGGAIQTSTLGNTMTYGLYSNPCPNPSYSQSAVQSIVEQTAPIAFTVINSACQDVRNYVWSDPYYQANYLTSTASGPITTTTSTARTTVTSTITSTILPASGIDLSFSSYSSPFTYGQNFITRGNSFPIQVNRPIEINMIAFYFSDRAYDTNPVAFTIVDPSNAILATGTIPALLRFASQQYYPIQLSQVITLQPGVTYKVNFAQLPPGDTYGAAGISQDIIQEAAPIPGTGYLGQSQWPVFQLGLMTVLSQGFAYHNYGPYTDLFSSPGYLGNGEIAMRFQTSKNEQLTSFEVYIWSSDSSSNQIVFTLRSDVNPSHPAPLASAPALATVSVPTSQAVAGTFLTVNFPNVPLVGGQYYWIVGAASAQHVLFGRLVNPYRAYALESHNDFQTWGPPSDGPTDLGFRITTTGESIVNTISGSSKNNYFSGIAQSFIPSASSQVKGAWLAAAPSGESMTVSIQTDSGDRPSGTILAQGSDQVLTQFTREDPYVYVGFSGYASLSAGTKYWLVATIGTCVSLSCSSPSSADTLTFRSDYAAPYAPAGGVHYELLRSSTWQAPVAGAMSFALVAPTGHEDDPIWGRLTTTVTTTSVQTVSQTTTSSTSTFLSSSSSDSSSSSSPSSTTSSTVSSLGISSSSEATAAAVSNKVYGISIDSTGGSVSQGGSAVALISVNQFTLPSPQVRLYAVPLQGGISASLEPDRGTAPFTTIFIAKAAPNVASGMYSIMITSVSNGGNYSIIYHLNVVQQQSSLPHDLTVVVRDVYGIPISGASVTLNRAGSSALAQTNGSGTVVFPRIPAGPYNVTVDYMGSSSVLSGDSNSPELDATVGFSPAVAITAAAVILATMLFLWRLKRNS